VEILTLEGYAGQKADVVIAKRNDGSIFVRFKFMEGYGYPSLELDKLKALIAKCDMLKE